MAHGETVYDVIESDLGAALVSAFNLIWLYILQMYNTLPFKALLKQMFVRAK